MKLGILIVLIGVLGVVVYAQTRPATQRAPVNVPEHNRVKLWEAGAPLVVAGADTFTDPAEPTMDCWAAEGKPTGAGVIIFPGGAYTHLAGAFEGADLARKFAANGVAAFVVRYRHAPRYKYPVPMMDAQRAIRLVKSKAADFGIDVNRLGVCGFSAGGHLAATVSAQFATLPKAEKTDSVDAIEARPAFAMLIYPVISLTNEPIVHKTSRESITGGDAKLYEALSAELHVTKDIPPTFIVHAAPDKTVPVENAILYYDALRKTGITAELHVFSQGKHGFGIGGNDPTLNIWPDLAIGFLRANHFLEAAATTQSATKPG